jgi:Spy/CpxP family protein refolding chaperone
MLKNLIGPVFFLLCAGTLLAQSAPSTATPPAQSGPGHRGAQENCMQQAGIEKSVMERVRSIAHDARSQIESVCSNTSLTTQQRQQQAREIREKAMQKREGLLTPDQQKTLAACQQAKSGHHPAEGGPHEVMGGGCGEMPHHGARPGSSPDGGQGSGTSNPPASNPSSPQN